MFVMALVYKYRVFCIINDGFLFIVVGWISVLVFVILVDDFIFWEFKGGVYGIIYSLGVVFEMIFGRVDLYFFWEFYLQCLVGDIEFVGGIIVGFCCVLVLVLVLVVIVNDINKIGVWCRALEQFLVQIVWYRDFISIRYLFLVVGVESGGVVGFFNQFFVDSLYDFLVFQ